MSFESFIENIEELSVLPTVEKQDGGYFYPEEMQGKLYRHMDKLMAVSISATDELPISMIEAIYHAIEESVVEDVQNALSNSSDDSKIEACEKAVILTNDAVQMNLTSMNTFKSNLELVLDGIKEDILNIRKDIVVNFEAIEEIQNKKQSNGVNLEMIQKIIDKKLDNVPARVGKIKISTLSMLKESGFSIEEISELAKNELI